MFIAILHRIIFFSSISLFIAHFLGKHTQYKGEPAECIFFLCFQTNKTPTNGKWNLRTRQNMQIITCRQRWENFLASGCWTCTLIQSVYQSRRIELCPFCAYIYIYILHLGRLGEMTEWITMAIRRDRFSIQSQV